MVCTSGRRARWLDLLHLGVGALQAAPTGILSCQLREALVGLRARIRCPPAAPGQAMTKLPTPTAITTPRGVRVARRQRRGLALSRVPSARSHGR
jgi:hypothetical protein